MKINHFLIVIILATSCQFNGENEDSAEITEDTTYIASVVLSDEDKQTIDNLIHSIGPPLEFFYIVNDLNLTFASDLLSSYEAVDAYHSSLDLALAMGVYGADLVYCYVYKKNDLALAYSEAIQQLAEKLHLSHIIDFKRLSDLASEDYDSQDLVNEFSTQMDKVYSHLKQNDQMRLSAMMSFGGWIESLHIASVAGKELGEFDQDMIYLIYYETLMSQSFIEIFQKFENLSGYENTVKELDELGNLYQDVEALLAEIQPEIKNSDSLMHIIDVSKQTITYDQEQFEQLTKQISKMRQDVVK